MRIAPRPKKKRRQRDQEQHGYYYDDETGYEVYDPLKVEDEEPENEIGS